MRQGLCVLPAYKDGQKNRERTKGQTIEMWSPLVMCVYAADAKEKNDLRFYTGIKSFKYFMILLQNLFFVFMVSQ